MKTLTLNLEELEQRIAPNAPGTVGADSPFDNQVRPPYFVLTPPVEL